MIMKTKDAKISSSNYLPITLLLKFRNFNLYLLFTVMSKMLEITELSDNVVQR